MPAENIDDITITYKEDDQELVRELEKVVLSRGSWTTILFKYQEKDKKTGEFRAPKASIRRYQKTGGQYRQRSKFNVSSGKQAREISAILTKWFPEGESDSEEPEE